MKTREAVKDVVLRECILPDDPGRIREILEGTNVFRACEIEVALELAAESIQKGESSDYRFILADVDGEAAGYVCYGMIPMTDRRFDIYWLAVDQGYQGRGIARLLTGRMEDRVREAGGSLIYIDTSSREPYRPARNFYRSLGYHEAARIPGYYADGDDKVIFVKRMSGGLRGEV